jgi:hypothetical protein
MPKLAWRSDPPRMFSNRESESKSFKSNASWCCRLNHLVGDHAFSPDRRDRADGSQDTVSGKERYHFSFRSNLFNGIGSQECFSSSSYQLKFFPEIFPCSPSAGSPFEAKIAGVQRPYQEGLLHPCDILPFDNDHRYPRMGRGGQSLKAHFGEFLQQFMRGRNVL